MEDNEIPDLIHEIRLRHPEAELCVVAIIDGALAVLGQGTVVTHLKEILNAHSDERRESNCLH